MKIEINLDIEDLVRQAIQQFINENLIINNVPGHTAGLTQELAQKITDALESGQDVGLILPKNRVDSDAQIAADTDNCAQDTVTTETPDKTKPGVAAGIRWEFGPKPGRRRSKTEIAMHEKELELGRLLTPEEKGITDANVEIGEEAEAAAKAATKNKNRIDGIAAEVTAAASKELAEEAQAAGKTDTPEGTTEVPWDESGDTSAPVESGEIQGRDSPEGQAASAEGEGEPEIPKTEPLDNLNSLFS